MLKSRRQGSIRSNLLIDILPIMYGLAFYAYVIKLSQLMRHLISPDKLLIIGIVPYILFVIFRFKRDFKYLRDPLRERNMLSKLTRFNGALIALILIFTVHIKTFWFLSFAVLLAVWITVLQAKYEKMEVDGKIAFLRSPVFYSRAAFYFTSCYAYFLAGKYISLLLTPVVAAAFIFVLFITLITQAKTIADVEKNDKRAVYAKNIATCLLLIVTYVVVLIILLSASRKTLLLNQFVASAVYFVPIYFFEKKISKHIRLKSDRVELADSSARFLWKNIFSYSFLFIVYFFWAIYFVHPASGMAWTQSHVGYAMKAMSLFIWARPVSAAFTAVLIVLLYVIFWIRRRQGRLLLAIVAPVAFLITNYIVFYWNLSGDLSNDNIEKQNGVKVICSNPTPPAKMNILEKTNYSTRFPRSIQIDEGKKKIYVSYGSIYANTNGSPSLMSVTENGRGMMTYKASGEGRTLVREFNLEEGADDIFVCTWGFNYKLLRLDRDDLKVIKSYDFNETKKQLKYYDAYDIIPQSKMKRVFLITGQPPAVIRFNLENAGRSGFVDVLDLSRDGVTEYGSILHRAVYDRSNNRIYSVAVTGDNNGMLLEIDPDNMKVLRKLNFKDIVISVVHDDARDEILVGCGLKRSIYGVDIKTFKVIKEYKTPVLTIRNFIIDTKNDRTYIADHLKGGVYILNRNMNKMIKFYKTGNKTMGIIKSGNYLYTDSTIGVVRIDLGKSAETKNEIIGSEKEATHR